MVCGAICLWVSLNNEWEAVGEVLKRLSARANSELASR